jgi:hypothetical protein
LYDGRCPRFLLMELVTLLQQEYLYIVKAYALAFTGRSKSSLLKMFIFHY